MSVKRSPYETPKVVLSSGFFQNPVTLGLSRTLATVFHDLRYDHCFEIALTPCQLIGERPFFLNPVPDIGIIDIHKPQALGRASGTLRDLLMSCNRFQENGRFRAKEGVEKGV